MQMVVYGKPRGSTGHVEGGPSKQGNTRVERSVRDIMKRLNSSANRVHAAELLCRDLLLGHDRVDCASIVPLGLGDADPALDTGRTWTRGTALTAIDCEIISFAHL